MSQNGNISKEKVSDSGKGVETCDFGESGGSLDYQKGPDSRRSPKVPK